MMILINQLMGFDLGSIYCNVWRGEADPDAKYTCII